MGKKIYISKKKEVINRIILVNSTGRVYMYNMTSAFLASHFKLRLELDRLFIDIPAQ